MQDRKNPPVDFTPAQLAYLDGLYPHTVPGPEIPEARVRYMNGQQSVMQTIRGMTRGRTSSDIDLPQRR